MSTKIIWEEPPASKRGNTTSSRMREVLTQLQAHPGRWAKVHEAKSNGGTASWWKKEGCEATTRRDRERGVTATYARWPEGKAAPTPAATPEPELEPEPEPEPAPAPGVATVRPLATVMTKGTCRSCGAKNRGLTGGVCRMCTIRAREAAAREAS